MGRRQMALARNLCACLHAFLAGDEFQILVLIAFGAVGCACVGTGMPVLLKRVRIDGIGLHLTWTATPQGLGIRRERIGAKSRRSGATLMLPMKTLHSNIPTSDSTDKICAFLICNVISRSTTEVGRFNRDRGQTNEECCWHWRLANDSISARFGGVCA